MKLHSGGWIIPILMLVGVWGTALTGAELENLGAITVFCLMAAGWAHTYDKLSDEKAQLERDLNRCQEEKAKIKQELDDNWSQ
jgi:cell division protein FtsB